MSEKENRPKIKQVWVSDAHSTRKYDCQRIIIALDENGELWILRENWIKYPLSVSAGGETVDTPGPGVGE